MEYFMNLGVRAHDFGKLEIEELAKKISEKKFKCIQLALHKAVAGLDTTPGYLNPGLANTIRLTLDKYGIYPSVLGCYINPIHPDKKEREKAIYRFKEHIRFARDFGGSVIGTETGSINPDCSFNQGTYTEEVFNDFVKVIADLVEEAEKFGAFVCLEPVADTHTINTPEKMKKVINVIQSNNLQVIFDPVNLIASSEWDKQDDMVKKSFDLFGERIVVIHVKDFVMEDGKKNGTLPAGKGIFNLEHLFKICKENKPGISFLLENNKPDTFNDCISYVKNIYDKC